jgi:hypothetical protein
MHDHDLKILAISVFKLDPDLSRLRLFRKYRKAQIRRLLRWLDQGGLTLYLFDRLRQLQALGELPEEFREALQRRLLANSKRTLDMLNEFRRLTVAFGKQGVCHCALKGFTLAPDFCPSLYLRHQTDFDFLVDVDCVEAAAKALYSCGYATDRLNLSGESCFATPLLRVPSERDDIFALQQHRQVDLHTSLWEDETLLPLEVPPDCLRHAQTRAVEGIAFRSLATEDAFLLQVLHAFSHALRSWMRVSWLLEISFFLDVHKNNDPLWNRFRDRAGQSLAMRRAFAFMIGLTNRLFPRPIPPRLKFWLDGALSDRMQIWLNTLGERWVLANWPGSLLNLFANTEFMVGADARKRYIKSRLFPAPPRVLIGKAGPEQRRAWTVARTAHFAYAGRRLALHLSGLAILPFQLARAHFRN